jgi:predicted SnoaL-like aldol condensation-catalyzing enzyme
MKMSQTIEEKNKALVLEALDTLFNKRDYTVAERYWPPDYIQHSAHIAPGREGLFDLIKSIPPTLRRFPAPSGRLTDNTYDVSRSCTL